MKSLKIFGVETSRKIEIPTEQIKDALVDEDLIHYDGTAWRFFEPFEKHIEEVVAIYKI